MIFIYDQQFQDYLDRYELNWEKVLELFHFRTDTVNQALLEPQVIFFN